MFVGRSTSTVSPWCPTIARLAILLHAMPPIAPIGFRGKLFCDAPPAGPVFGLRHAIFMERSGGVAAIVCDTTGSTVRQESCDRCLAMVGRQLVGVWIGGVWNAHFSEFEKQFFRGRNLQENANYFRKKSGVDQIRGTEFEISEPAKKAIPYSQPFHTPLDSLLDGGGGYFSRVAKLLSMHVPPIFYQESPRQTKPKKGPKRKVHMNVAHFCVNSGVFPQENKHFCHIELLFRNAPAKSS